MTSSEFYLALILGGTALGLLIEFFRWIPVKLARSTPPLEFSEDRGRLVPNRAAASYNLAIIVALCGLAYWGWASLPDAYIFPVIIGWLGLFIPPVLARFHPVSDVVWTSSFIEAPQKGILLPMRNMFVSRRASIRWADVLQYSENKHHGEVILYGADDQTIRWTRSHSGFEKLRDLIKKKCPDAYFSH